MICVAGAAAAVEVQLTDAEAAKLALLAQQGNQQARDTLAHGLMGLALSIAGAYSRQNSWVDEVEIQGEALESMLHYGIDHYNPDKGLPVRVWVALTIRRRLAAAVEKAHDEEAGRALLAKATEKENAVLPPEPDAATDLGRILKWAHRGGILTQVQTSVLVLRGQGLQFNEISQRLGIHRKKASREYALAVAALQADLETEL